MTIAWCPGAYKFAAALQAAQSCDHPIALAVETRVGHGAGTPTAQMIEKLADRYAFAVWALESNRLRSPGPPTGRVLAEDRSTTTPRGNWSGRLQLVRLIRRAGDMEVVAEARDGVEVVEAFGPIRSTS